MQCPYCDTNMVSGYLYGDRYRAKWLPDSEGLTLGLFAIGGEPIGKLNFLGRQKIRAHRCSSCKKIIIDLNDSEN